MFKVKMVQKQWLQLKMKSLWGSNMKIVTQSRGNEPLMGDKKLVGGGYCRKIFSSSGMNKILAPGETPVFSYWGHCRVPSVGRTIIFRLLFFKASVRYFLYFFYFSSNDSPSKTIKDVFQFIQKALFVLEIFKFLYFRLPLFFSLSAIALEVDSGKMAKFMTSSFA